MTEPKKFEGTRSAKDLENFIWDIQEYFVVANIPEERQVSMASVFMTGDAKLWYRLALRRMRVLVDPVWRLGIP